MSWVTENEQKSESPAALFSRNYVIIANDNGEVGCCSLKKIGISLDFPHRGKTGEISYWVGKTYQRKSYASGAAQQVTNKAFDEFGLDTVNAHFLLQSNEPSKTILCNLGFRQETDGQGSPISNLLVDPKSDWIGVTQLPTKWRDERDNHG
jgi:RimJ/RimL family protein N-acetyltransferase